jgi:hypothetical protein
LFATTENFTVPERVVIQYDHGSLTATTTVKRYVVPAGRQLVVDFVHYHNITGLAENASNAFALTVQNGSTVVANGIDTDSDEAGTNTLPADTTVAMTVVTAAGANVLAAGDTLSFVFTEDGTATLPAGFFTVHGRLV